jgi:hypothetical protein
MDWAAFTARPEFVAAALGGIIVLAAVAFFILKRRRNRPSPEELERLRRLELNSIGKLKAGQVTDVDGAVILYSYNVAGVEYSASQDVGTLQEFVPDNPASILGPAGVKFDPRNPANSMVVCEEWSGLQRVKVRRS